MIETRGEPGPAVAAILLAAGRSSRFGADKLGADLGGARVGLHAARSLTGIALSQRLVVTREALPDWSGFEPVINSMPEAGMSRSIALGVAKARAAGAGAVLIALADMPFVPAAHFLRVLARYRGEATIAASRGVPDSPAMPPALFGAFWFDALQDLDGDRGARDLLDRAEIVPTAPEHLLDIDRPDDLVRARARLAMI